MSLKVFLSLVVLTLMSLTGCATAPEHVQHEASKHLSPECSKLYLGGSFQTGCQIPGGLLVLAIGSTASNQICTYAGGNSVDGYTWQHIESKAIAKCKKRGGSSCQVFARCNDIVYKSDEQRQQERWQREQQELRRQEAAQARREALERERLEEERRAAARQKIEQEIREIEEQERQLQTPSTPPPVSDKMSMEKAKAECEELGFTPKTERFGECVLQLTD